MNMKMNEIPRLCGGTYFILQLNARGQRMGIRDSLMGEKDGLSEPEVLFGLARVVTPDIKDPLPSMENTIRGNTFDFKSCKNYGGGFFMLGDNDARQSFDVRVKKEYAVALNAMCSFVDRYVDVNGSRKKDIKLVKALLDLIDQDNSINDNQPFYVCEDGHPISKKQICSETHFCLDSFLLGVWHYALLRPEGNEIGQDTFEDWCPSQGGGHREYQGTMGVNLNREITIFRHEVIDDEISSEAVDPEIVDMSEQPSDSESSLTEQSINNPTVFQFIQNGNHNTQIGQVENYYAPQEEDSDER